MSLGLVFVTAAGSFGTGYAVCKARHLKNYYYDDEDGFSLKRVIHDSKTFAKISATVLGATTAVAVVSAAAGEVSLTKSAPTHQIP